MARDNPVTIPLRCGSLGAAEFFHLALEGGVQTLEIRLLREDQKVDIFAKLGCAVCDGEREERAGCLPWRRLRSG
jgi:hypothetical protein